MVQPDARDVIARALHRFDVAGIYDGADAILAALHDAGFVVARIDRGMFDAVLSTLVDESYSCGHGLGSDDDVSQSRAELTAMVFGKDQP